jgi:hypothetical protein
MVTKYLNLLKPVLQIRDVYPGSRIRIKEFEYFNPKKLFLSSRKYDPGYSSRIRIPIFLPIPDPMAKKAPDPASGSATNVADPNPDPDLLDPHVFGPLGSGSG